MYHPSQEFFTFAIRFKRENYQTIDKRSCKSVFVATSCDKEALEE